MYLEVRLLYYGRVDGACVILEYLKKYIYTAISKFHTDFQRV